MAASFFGGPIAPGSLLSIFGQNLCSTAAGAYLDPISGRVGDLLAGCSVRFNGKPSPLLFVIGTSVNVTPSSRDSTCMSRI